MDDIPDAGSAAPEVPGYDVGRLLGRGGTAAVWLVIERSTGRDFALKCFIPGTPDMDDGGTVDQEAEEALRREVRILSALHHDHLLRAHTVLRLVDPGSGPEARQAVGLVLDYAPGGSVADLVAGRGRLGAGETVTILTPIAQALAYLHSHGFTHGDVSPGNVLFTAHGKPLLADVGMARMVADAGSARVTGTEGFSDPAPIDAVRAGLQPERDVYSLAALGWYCLTGRPPGPDVRRPPLPLLVPDVPPALAAALEAGLDEDRRQRPSAAELAAAVFRSTSAEPVDLSVTVHPTVVPQLLTRRTVRRSAGERCAKRLHGWVRGWLRRPGQRRQPLPRGVASPAPGTGTGSLGEPGLWPDAGRIPDAGSLLDAPPAHGVAEAGDLSPAARPAAHSRTAPATAARHAASGATARHAAADSSPGSRHARTFDSGLDLVQDIRQRAGQDIRHETRRDNERDGRHGAGQGARHGTRHGPLEAGRRRGRPKVWTGVAVVSTLLAGLGGSWMYRGGTIQELFAAVRPPASTPGEAGTAADATGAPDAGAGTSSRVEGPTRTPAPTAVPRELRDLLESADPEQAVRGLAALRSLAFSSGDMGLLDEVSVPGSAAAAADARIRTQLSGPGHVLAGFSTSLTRIETTADSSPGRAVVAISTASSGYQELDDGGNVVGEVPATVTQQLQLVLVPVDGHWRIQDVLPPGPEAG